MHVIVWDFDGVLNANVIDGRFVWTDTLDADWGIDAGAFAAHVFHRDRIGQIMRGKRDLREVVQLWLTEAGHDVSADAFLAYWFAKDALPDDRVLHHLNRADLRHVIGTNNEPRRAAYIEHQMGFGDLVEAVFASGRIGHAKPDPAYFEHIEAWSRMSSSAHVLIDDTEPNVEAARARGWQAFHFTDQTRDGLAAFLDQLS